MDSDGVTIGSPVVKYVVPQSSKEIVVVLPELDPEQLHQVEVIMVNF